MTYRPTLTSAMGLYVVGVLFAILLSGAGLLSRPIRVDLVVAGALVGACLVAIRLRCVVTVGDEGLRVRNLFGEKGIKWHDVAQVRGANENGYWASRLYGPSTLEFVSLGSTLRINFKLFPERCLEDVMRHVPRNAEVPEWACRPPSA